ncbi:hypothetical protein BLD44_028100 [Mastigocladus laminosus UU774]|nr:MAG: hypothetical protein C6Y22_13045 [Hapalosiphonaceae cyanobacterium JJU2]TBR60016.1 hypothetical protein B4U84_03700 [Westiellopsis prolifica IICB1]TFI51118.1 hypothetical protein BLD44_028100 [Mastigocladus laminosus UU774]
MNKVQLALVISYLLMTCYFSVNWLRFHLRHPANSPEDKFLSLVMLAIAIFSWPLVIPMHCLQTFKTRHFEFSTAVPVLVAISAFGLVFYII